MLTFLEIGRTGVTAVRLHPLRSLVSACCLLVVLVPYLVGVALSGGVAREASASVRFGADLYVSSEALGSRAPLPLSVISEFRAVPGVTAVVPRIVGPIALGKDREPAVLVGIPAAALPAGTRCVAGRLYREGKSNELVVGTEIARRLNLRVGSRIPPFYHNNRGERLSEVVGIFRSDVSLWQSRMILTSMETAAAVFAQEGMAGEMLVYCEPGRVEAVRQAIWQRFLAAAGPVSRLRITTRADLEALLPAGLSHQSGIFQLHFLVALAATILVLAVTSGIGLPDRRREIGILKATGWQTDEILLRGTVESLLVSLSAACAALLLAFAWLKWGNGYGIASLLLPGAPWRPTFKVPYDFSALPVFLAFLLSWLVVTAGTLTASWRVATVPPREALA